MTSVIFATEMCRIRPVTVTYAPPAFRSSGTKYSMVTSGRSGRRAMSATRRRFNSAASCASSSRLSTLSRAVPYRRLVARQRGKRRELGGPFAERHLRMVSRDVVRQVNDVIVVRLHLRCPPTCSFRSLPVAPSTKFVPFRMAFFPIRFLMPMIASCRRFSLSSSACSSAFCFSSAS